MTIRQRTILLVHALIGWALCGATMGIGMATTSLQNTLIVHAIGAPLFFMLVSLVYFKTFNYTTPLQTALIFAGFVMAVDFFVVALVINRSLALFASVLGTWLPFALIFTSTYLTGRWVVIGTRHSAVAHGEHRGMGDRFKNDRVLVAYASKHGATAAIAERIGHVLRHEGLPADVVPVDQVNDVTSYNAVVVGSAVYIGRWRTAAARFLQANEAALAQKPVWLFSSGPTGEGDPVDLTQGWRLPGKLEPLADRIAPRDIAVFHGAVDVGKLNFIEKWMIKNVKAPVGDFRDWEAITSWARDIAAVLNKVGLASRTVPLYQEKKGPVVA